MTDIPALIERANIVCATDDARRKPWLGTDVKGLLREMAEALSLAVSPLPGEIAGLLALKEGLPEGPWTLSRRTRPQAHIDQLPSLKS